MIYPQNTTSQPAVHTTLVFKVGGLLGTHERDEALHALGVPATAAGTEPGPWLACGVDSDGTVRLWPDVHSS
ncbi:MAG: hypothetical protein RBT68_12070 [Spirochaetia bacterium]|nr:hypothetical protein [Spirochaetia bacterium]